MGRIDNEGVLTVPVMPDNSLRLWCGAVGTPQPRVAWSKGTDTNLPGQSNSLVIENFTGEHEVIKYLQILYTFYKFSICLGIR